MVALDNALSICMHLWLAAGEHVLCHGWPAAVSTRELEELDVPTVYSSCAGLVEDAMEFPLKSAVSSSARLKKPARCELSEACMSLVLFTMCRHLAQMQITSIANVLEDPLQVCMLALSLTCCGCCGVRICLE